MLTLNKKVLKIIMLIFCILAFYYSNVQAVVSPTSNFYVNDYADVLSKQTEEYIMNTNIELNNKTKAQIVVVTVKSLDGKPIEEYATELFRNFGIGDKSKNNGVLLLCSTGDRKFRIEVGYGLEGRLTDGKTGRIQDDYIIPYLKNDNYDEGIKNGYSAVLEEVCKEYNIEITGAQKANSIGLDDSILTVYVAIITISFLVNIFGASKSKIMKKICYTFNIASPFVYYFIAGNVNLSVMLFVINIVLFIRAKFSPLGSGRGRFYGGRRWWLFSEAVFLGGGRRWLFRRTEALHGGRRKL